MLSSNANSRFSHVIHVALIAATGLVSCGGAPSSIPAPIDADAPTVTLSAGSTSIAYNGSTTISWTSTNATSCTSTGGGGTDTSGSFGTGALTSTTSYTVTCSNSSRSSSGSITITVAPSAITAVADAGSGNVTFTTANNLSAGSIITISGTTNYNGTYTVVSATSTTFTITHAYTAETFTTASWQRAGGMISGCTTSGDTGAITLSTSPSRFSGVAPLAVYFDASGTTATATTRPFHDLEYRWTFGDNAGSPVNGTTWSTGGRPGVSSRNEASGPEAGHVYETPGQYTVTLTVTDGTNTVTNSCALIVAENPETVFAGSNTVCIAATSVPVAGAGGCPAGANVAQQSSFASAINTHALSNRRVLFRRGDTFSASSSGLIDQTGPGIVGAYGSGAKPVINGSGTTPPLRLGSGSTVYSDWRFMDLSINGQNGQAGENVGISTGGPFNRVTILRVDVAGTSSGFAASHWILSPGQQSYDQWAIHDSTASGVPNCNWTGHYICNWRIYVVGTRWSIQGNLLDNLGNPSTLYAGGSHVIRSEMLQNSVISNNSLKGAGDFQLDIKLHAWLWGGGGGGNATSGTYTEKILIADNRIEGGANPWMISLGPQNDESDERVRDVIVERNWFTSNSQTQMHMHVNSSATTIRNNISDMTNGVYRHGIGISKAGATPAPVDVHVYNNTFYSGAAGEFSGIDISTATDTILRNNLACAPSSGGPTLYTGQGTNLTQSNNHLNNSAAALFVSSTPSVPDDFRLKALPNPARNTGLTTTPVYSDFFLVSRPQSGTTDIGATEQ